ncbi:MAG: ROK family transcriptional regulator [Actinobacteria bacterium]|nr:ROK family transcriptional regulator [Actinomycetota bacterium]
MYQKQIRNYNRKITLNTLIKNEKLTKKQISDKIGLSLQTVNGIINDLALEKVISEEELADSTGGRRPVYVNLIDSSRFTFGVDFHSNYVRIILANLKSKIIKDIIIKVPQSDYKKGHFDKIMGRVYSSVEKIISEQNISEDKILGIGYSFPGIVDEKRKLLIYCPNLFIKNLDFSKYERMFSFPCYIGNDANLAAFAESKLGVAKSKRNMVYVYIVEGVGFGIIIRGKLYKGHNERAGEFGHIIIEKDGKKCICGKRGCWNAYISIDTLISDYNRSSNHKIKSLEEFIELLKLKDNKAKKALEKYLDYMSIGLINLIMTIDPYYIIIGGKISKIGSSYLIKPLEKKIPEDNLFIKKKDINLLLSKLREDGSVLGASLISLKDFLYIDNYIS